MSTDAPSFLDISASLQHIRHFVLYPQHHTHMKVRFFRTRRREGHDERHLESVARMQKVQRGL